ncbi:MAG: porin family protein [Geobacteraceae bacterium]
MKKLIVFACLATTISITAGAAMADSIKGRVGVTGKIGFLIPTDNNAEFFNNRTDPGFIVGGGLIYGLNDHIAAGLDVTRTEFGSDTGDFGITNVSLGGQYRFALTNRQLVPYLGAGLDILLSDYDVNGGARRDVDTTVGVHISGGVDYFFQKNLALTAEAKLVAAPDTDITDSFGVHKGDFDPTSFSTTFGIRYFFN